MSNELVVTIAIAKTHYFCLFMFVNISCIPSSLEDEDLKLFDSEVLKPWFEDETMISK
jgi:hypothetical protein